MTDNPNPSDTHTGPTLAEISAALANHPRQDQINFVFAHLDSLAPRPEEVPHTTPATAAPAAAGEGEGEGFRPPPGTFAPELPPAAEMIKAHQEAQRKIFGGPAVRWKV